MYSFTCWSVAGRPGTSDLLLEARVRSCTHTPRPKGRINPARRFGRTTAGLRPPCVRPNRPTYVSLTGQGCCRAIDESVPTIRERVLSGTTVYADEAPSWDALHARYDTKRINHSIAFSDDGA